MAADKTDSDNSDHKSEQAQFIPASKALQARAPLINKNLNTALREANMLLSDTQDDYVEWVQADIGALESAYKQLLSAPDSQQAKRDLFSISHDMRGQGTTFGYPLVTQVLGNLCDFLEARGHLSQQNLHVVGLHISTISQIITHRLSGQGGEMGDEVMSGLLMVLDKKD